MFLPIPEQSKSRKIHLLIGVFCCALGLLLTAFASPAIYGLLLIAVGAVPLCASLFLGEARFASYARWLGLFKG